MSPLSVFFTYILPVFLQFLLYYADLNNCTWCIYQLRCFNDINDVMISIYSHLFAFGVVTLCQFLGALQFHIYNYDKGICLFIFNKSLEQSKYSFHNDFSFLYYLVRLNTNEHQITLKRTYRFRSGLTVGIGPLWENSAYRKIRKAYYESQEWSGVPV